MQTSHLIAAFPRDSTLGMGERSQSAIAGDGAPCHPAGISTRTSFPQDQVSAYTLHPLGYLSAAALNGNVPLGLFALRVEYPPNIRE
jgi:hypothetical protein